MIDATIARISWPHTSQLICFRAARSSAVFLFGFARGGAAFGGGGDELGGLPNARSSPAAASASVGVGAGASFAFSFCFFFFFFGVSSAAPPPPPFAARLHADASFVERKGMSHWPRRSLSASPLRARSDGSPWSGSSFGASPRLRFAP